MNERFHKICFVILLAFHPCLTRLLLYCCCFQKAQCSTVVVHHLRQLLNSTKPHKPQTHEPAPQPCFSYQSLSSPKSSPLLSNLEKSTSLTLGRGSPSSSVGTAPVCPRIHSSSVSNNLCLKNCILKRDSLLFNRIRHDFKLFISTTNMDVFSWSIYIQNISCILI